MRQCGYAPSRNRYREESFVRRAGGGEFPRFHVYADDRGPEWVLDLHLDQRSPSYGGTRAHGGEHTGPVIEAEVERIRHILV